MIPTYNCAHYLRETLTSVLVQDPGPEVMQVEVVDDASTRDDPEAVVAEVGRGRVGFFRQPKNVGHVWNFNTCLRRARGELVHLLHGDDRVEAGFFTALGNALLSRPEIGAAFCRVVVIDDTGRRLFLKPLMQSESGLLHHSLRRIAVDQPIQPPSMVVRRSVYEKLGGFDDRFERCGEDLEMWIRIAARYPIWYEIEPLALYRALDSSLSGQAVRTGQNIRETRLAIHVSRDLFPPESAGDIDARARRKIGLWGVAIANKLARDNDFAAARVQLSEALRCSRSWSVVVGAARVGVKCLRRRTARSLQMVLALGGRRTPAAKGKDERSQ
jgi:hypothetical protein